MIFGVSYYISIATYLWLLISLTTAKYSHGCCGGCDCPLNIKCITECIIILRHRLRRLPRPNTGADRPQTIAATTQKLWCPLSAECLNDCCAKIDPPELLLLLPFLCLICFYRRRAETPFYHSNQAINLMNVLHHNLKGEDVHIIDNHFIMRISLFYNPLRQCGI